jgi:hypothetical protein
VEPDEGPARRRLDLDAIAELASNPEPAAAGTAGVGRLRAGERIRYAGPMILDLADELGVHCVDPHHAAPLSVSERVHRHLVSGEDDFGCPSGRQGRLEGSRADKLAHADEAGGELEGVD